MESYPSIFKRTLSLVSMMRLPNCIMIGFAVITSETIALQMVLPGAEVASYGFLAGFFLLAASMVLNDYFDREIDVINQPNKPLPSGTVKPSEALSFAIILGSLGLLFAADTGPRTLLIAIVSVALMISYNMRLKRLGAIGNAIVSANMAIPFIYGGFAVASYPTWTLVIFAALAFLSGMGREIMKGIVDVQGDSAKGVKSVAVNKGSAVAGRQSTTLFIIAVVLSSLPILLGLVNNYYIPLVAICDAGLILTAYSISRSPTPRNAKRDKNFVLVWMTFGLLAFVIGTL
jgi:geranylgeranylglycerol-phosphate geranylgeranyltransferase